MTNTGTTRIDDGEYMIVGRPDLTIIKALSEWDRPLGWDLIVDGEWSDRFDTKREAVEAAGER